MVNNLVDMEWKFGVTASTDELRQVGSTFLQLKLTIDKGGEARYVATRRSSLETQSAQLPPRPPALPRTFELR